MNKYVLLALPFVLATSFSPGLHAVLLNYVKNESNQTAYIAIYTPQFTGEFGGARGQIREEWPFYKAEPSTLYVIPKGAKVAQPQEILATAPNQPDQIIAVITKKGEKLINPELQRIDMIIRADGTPVIQTAS